MHTCSRFAALREPDHERKTQSGPCVLFAAVSGSWRILFIVTRHLSSYVNNGYWSSENPRDQHGATVHTANNEMLLVREFFGGGGTHFV